jgi:hypothetical protein
MELEESKHCKTLLGNQETSIIFVSITNPPNSILNNQHKEIELVCTSSNQHSFLI